MAMSEFSGWALDAEVAGYCRRRANTPSSHRIDSDQPCQPRAPMSLRICSPGGIAGAIDAYAGRNLANFWQPSSAISGSSETDAVETYSDRNAHRRNKRHPTRKRVLWDLHLTARGARKLRHNPHRLRAQQLFCRLYGRRAA